MSLHRLSYLSESGHILNDSSVCFDPGDLWHGGPSRLADDFCSGGVAEVHLVGRFLDEHRPGGHVAVHLGLAETQRR